MKNKIFLACIYSLILLNKAIRADLPEKVLMQIEQHALSEWQKVKEIKEQSWNSIFKNHQDTKEYYEKLQTYEQELFLGLIILDQIQLYVERCDSSKFKNIENIANKIELLKNDHEKLTLKINTIKNSSLNSHEKTTKQNENLQKNLEKLTIKCTELLDVIDPILTDAASCIIVEPTK